MSAMKQAFVIMQIGNPDLDNVFREVFVPAAKNSGLDPKRVDKHNEGRLLKSEIVNFIEDSDIIIADLTNERPNCYLEIGYAMGLDKFRNLILTAREDHNQESPNHKKGGPKIHFDLSGYDILFWDPTKLKGFKEELEKRIKRRLSTLPSYSTSTPIVSPWDDGWIDRNREIALLGLKECGKTGFMELKMTLPDQKLSASQVELVQVADAAQIHTFGWPIGVVLHNREEFRPKPKADGIVAEINVEDRSTVEARKYDYWTIRKDGSFYLLKSLFEDSRKPNSIFFNTRIVRITEALLYAVRLYTGLKVQPDSRLLIGFRHGGLKGRNISATSSRELGIHGKAIEDEVYTELETAMERIEPDLVNLVQKLTTPLFVIFDFFQIDKSILEEIVNKFVDGRVT
jgi:hypothetical protein